jgi:hypothetical protein
VFLLTRSTLQRPARGPVLFQVVTHLGLTEFTVGWEDYGFEPGATALQADALQLSHPSSQIRLPHRLLPQRINIFFYNVLPSANKHDFLDGID